MDVRIEEGDRVRENERLARNVFIAFCVASTLFMVLIVLIGTMHLTQ